MHAAEKQWIEILTNAANLNLKTIVYPNTGNENDLVNDNIRSIPPTSLPGKLLAFLFHRFKHFNGEPGKGISIVSAGKNNNAETLEATLLELAHLNNLNPEFLDWIKNSKSFL